MWRRCHGHGHGWRDDSNTLPCFLQSQRDNGTSRSAAGSEATRTWQPRSWGVFLAARGMLGVRLLTVN